MKTHYARLAWVAAAAIVGALSFAWGAPLRAASPTEGQPAPGMMDHGATGMVDHGATGMMGPGGAGMMDHAKPSDGDMRGMMQHHEQMMQMMARMHGQPTAGGGPTLAGQDAFGAVAEVVRLLESDPKTGWSKVDLEALRQHLIDMNDVTLQANVSARPVDGGLEMTVTGAGRTLGAIQRMAPAHAAEINGLNGWTAKAVTLGNGAELTVTGSDPNEVQHIRGLGFIGILMSGSHHQPHHLAMAKGEPVHAIDGQQAQHAR